MSTAPVDPTTPQALEQRADFYNDLRNRCPVAKVQQPEYYILSSYQNVKRMLLDHESFTKAWSNQYARGEHNYALNQDPPQFDDFRALYSGYMSPRGSQRWAKTCYDLADQLIDTLEPLGHGDLQTLFAKPFPALMTATVLGLPVDQLDRYRAWTDAFLETMISDPAAQARVIQEMYAFFDEEFERRRLAFRNAGIDTPAPEHVGDILDDNLISVLMTSKYRGRYLDNDELRRTVRGFFVGGVDTTGALILNVLHRLLERPELWDAVRADPSLISAAIEESLRFDPPATGMFRGATCSLNMDGVDIPENARVFYSLWGVNRDPSVFDDPDAFRLDRNAIEGQYHLSFGAGAHFCPGAWTARMEAKVALELLVQRLPQLRLTGPVQRYPIVNVWVVSNFPAAWD